MKICKKCKENKDTSAFYTDIRHKDGLYARCKKCHTAYRKKQVREADYIPTIKDILNTRWCSINTRGANKGYENVEVRLTKGAFCSYMNNQQLDTMYKQWVDSGKSFRLTPSVDRINPDGHYEIGNIRWLTFGENAGRARRKGVHRKLKIEQYTKSGKYVQTFDSVTDAAKAVNGSGTNIGKNAKGQIPSAYGHTWKYAVSPETPSH